MRGGGKNGKGQKDVLVRNFAKNETGFDTRGQRKSNDSVGC